MDICPGLFNLKCIPEENVIALHGTEVVNRPGQASSMSSQQSPMSLHLLSQ